jgi:arsenic resistance protein ArsH
MSPHKTQSDVSVAAPNDQHQPQYNISEVVQGDLNNTTSMRKVDRVTANPEFAHLSLAIPASEEHDACIRSKYRPFLLDDAVAADDWVAKLELAAVTEMAQHDISTSGKRLRILVLYGSLRSR